MAYPEDNYFQRKAAAEEEQGQRRFNIEEAMKDKLNPQIQGSFNEYSTALTKKLYGPTFRDEYEEIDAPSSNPARPRALKLGYNPYKKSLVIIFRPNQKINPLTGNYSDTGPAPWILYTDEVSLELWEGLKNCSSTGEYLRTSGIDNMGYTRVYSAASLPRTRPGEFQTGSQEQ